MDITQNQKSEKKKLARTSEKRSRDSTAPKINGDTYTLDDGRVVTIAPDLKDLPEFDWDNPDQKKWAEKQLEKWRRKEPNLTSEELNRRVNALLESEKELRKKSPY